MPLSLKDRTFLNLQKAMSYCLLLILDPVVRALYYCHFRFSVDGGSNSLKAIREKYADIRKAHPGPMLICTNHLTYIDSLIQAVILSSTWGYVSHLSGLAWNLPERKNFYHKFIYRVICYLGRCIPVERGASPADAKQVTNQMLHVLRKKGIISIFPEGKRSRDGLVDDKDFSYGVGQLLNEIPEASVLCVYMRGTKDGGFTHFPAKGESYYMDLNVFTPVSDLKGLRRARDISTQIISRLKEMESNYFGSSSDVAKVH
jgi:1-acyl-sn-glycerol-3-phosphate acyltransferase